MLAHRMRSAIGSGPINRLSRYAGVKPDRSGSDDEIEEWFRVQMRACQKEIQCLLTDKFFRDDDMDRSHIALIHREIDELEDERDEWRRLYKGQSN